MTGTIISAHGHRASRRAGRGRARRLRRRPALLRPRQEAGVAGARPALERPTADPRGEELRLPAAPCAAKRHVALRPHPAAPGGHARLRDVLAAPERRARPRGEALLLDDGAGRVAPHRGVAQADQRGRRHRRARPVPRRAGAHDARGGHARGEGLPDAGLLRATDHLALPADRARLARNGARGSLQPARDRRRYPPRRGDGLRARPARGRGQEDAADARGRGKPAASDLRPARALAAQGARGDRASHVRARRAAAARGPRGRGQARPVARPRRQRRGTAQSSRWPPN